MKNMFYVLIGLLLASKAAVADGYGEAGCGLGSVIMGKDGNQVMASSTNSSTYTNVLGIISGTSNCTDHGSVKQSQKIPLFIETNKLALQKDSARGTGEALVSLASMMGCRGDNFGHAMRANYGEVFGNDNPSALHIEKTINSIVTRNPSENCGA